MKKCAELTAVFVGGGLIYALLEVLFRGFTHWSMAIVGGVAVVGVYMISSMKERLWKKWVMGAAVILTVEFVAGMILNIMLGWRVWDYSDYRFQLYGQICLPFALYWFLLCIPANALCTVLREKVFK